MSMVTSYKPRSCEENVNKEKIIPPNPPARRRKKIIKIPIEPSDKNALAVFSGRRSAKILDPSRGGIGIRLNMASKRFNLPIIIKSDIKKNTVSLGAKFANNLTIKLARIAKITLDKGPAKETKAKSFLPSLRLKTSTGTGLAAPIIIGEPVIRRRRGRAILIMGSICFWGFRVNLPISRAVGSPKRSATYP
jgi:hypothetical protein